MRPLRVLQVLEATAGGTRQHLIGILHGLDRDVIDVEVAGPLARDGHEKDTRFVDEVRALDIPFHACDLHRKVSLVADTRGLWQLWRVMRRGRYDVVHLHSSKAGFLGRVAAKLCGTPTVYTPNGFYFLNSKSRVKRGVFLAAERVAGWLTDRMIAVSNSERDATVAGRVLPERKLVVIPNAIDVSQTQYDPAARDRIRAEFGFAPDTPLVGTVSRFIAQKDPLAMVAAARRVFDLVPESRFLWVGENGALEDATKAAVRDAELGDRFVFAGFRHDVLDVMTTFDVFALSSIFEGMPYALLEAMYLGLPIVATDVVGSRDVVVDGETGVLVEPRQPDRLAEGLAALLRDPARRARMGEASRARVTQEFELSRMVAKLEALYRELAGR